MMPIDSTVLTISDGFAPLYPFPNFFISISYLAFSSTDIEMKMSGSRDNKVRV
jgi:hypothetical protein